MRECRSGGLPRTLNRDDHRRIGPGVVLVQVAFAGEAGGVRERHRRDVAAPPLEHRAWPMLTDRSIVSAYVTGGSSVEP
jgi:hypothetical protein